MWHLCDGSLHSGRKATIPPSGPSLVPVGFSRSRQSLPTIKKSDAMMNTGTVRMILLRVRTRVKAIASTAVTGPCVTIAAFQTSGATVQTTVHTSASLHRAMLSLRSCISCSGIGRVPARSKRRPRTAAEQQKHTDTRKKRLGVHQGQQSAGGKHRGQLIESASRRQEAQVS